MTRSCLLISMICQFASVAAAQARPSTGFWTGVSLGYGSAKASCESCVTSPRAGGMSGSIVIGKTLSRSIRLGAAVDGWTDWHAGGAESMSALAASLQWFPFPLNGLYLRTGLGVARYHARSSPAVAGNGWGATVNLGYEQPVSHHLALAPAVGFDYGFVGDVTVSDGGAPFASGSKQDVVHISLAVMYHWGGSQ